MRLIGSEHAGCNSCFEIAHLAPFAFEAVW
jgi:hypothetical protein